MPPLPRRSRHVAPRLTLALLLSCALSLVRAAHAAPPNPPSASTPSPGPAGAPTQKSTAPNPPSGAPDEAERVDKARTLFKQGVADADAGRWPAAYAALTTAWKLKQHWQIAYQLARAEVSTGHIMDAIGHLGFALSSADDGASQSRQKLRDLLDEARGRLAYLRVTGPPHGTLILVDGEVRGALPLAGPLAVDPGEREIVLRLGKRSTSARVVATSGQTSEARLDFPRPPPDPAPTPAPAAVATPPDPDRVPLALGVAGITFGTAAAVVGGVLWAEADANQARYDDLQEAPPSPLKETSLAQSSSSINAQRTGAAIAWGSAGLLALGGIAYWIFAPSTSSSASPPATVTLVPAISPDHAGLTLIGSW